MKKERYFEENITEYSEMKSPGQKKIKRTRNKIKKKVSGFLL